VNFNHKLRKVQNKCNFSFVNEEINHELVIEKQRQGRSYPFVMKSLESLFVIKKASFGF